MNNNAKAIFFVLCGVFLAVSMAFSIISYDRNPIVPFGLFLGVSGLAAGLFFGGKAMPWLIVLFAFMDLVKRFLALSYNYHQLDVAVILAGPPLMILGMLLREFQLCFRKRELLKKENLVMLGFPTVIFVLSAAFLGVSMAALQDIANLSAYPFLVFILVRSMKTKRQVISLLSWSMLVFFAVAVYGIKQSHAGFTEFEERYLKSGLTIQVKQLYDVTLRPFSTVTTPGAYGYVCGVFSILALTMASVLPRRFGRHSDIYALPIWRWLLYLVALILGAAVIYSRTRACWAAYLLTLGCAFFFRYRITTILAYVSSFLAYLTVILSARTILDKDLLRHWTVQLRDWLIETFGAGQGEFLIQSSRLQTFTVRLGTYSNVLTNPDYWTPFGLSNEEYQQVAWIHDSLTLLLIRLGYIPMFILLGAIGCIFYLLHKALLSLPSRGGVRAMAAALLAAAAGAILLSVGSGYYLHIFPVGGVFYLCIGLLVVIWRFYIQSQNADRVMLTEQARAKQAAAAASQQDKLIPAMGRNA